jgi:hypothetical protein
MAGRPPKEKSFANMLRIAISAPGVNGTKLRDVAEKLVACALAGEPWAIQQIADRLDGKPAQEAIVDITEHRYVARIPEKAPSAEAWQQQHSPQTTIQ